MTDLHADCIVDIDVDGKHGALPGAVLLSNAFRGNHEPRKLGFV